MIKCAPTGLPQALYELGHDHHLNDQLSWLDFARTDLLPLEIQHVKKMCINNAQACTHTHTHI